MYLSLKPQLRQEIREIDINITPLFILFCTHLRIRRHNIREGFIYLNSLFVLF